MIAMALRVPVSSAVDIRAANARVSRVHCHVRGPLTSSNPQRASHSRCTSSCRSTRAHASSSDSTSEPDRVRTGTLSNPEQQQFAFSALALVYTGVAAATTWAPVWSLTHLLQVSGALQTADNILVASTAARGMLVVAGAYTWLLTACLMCLKDAAAHKRLDSDTYKRLLLGVMYQGIIATVLWARNMHLIPNKAWMYPMGLFLCTAFVAGRVYAVTVGKVSLPDVVKGFLSNIRETFRPQTPVSAFYAVCALLALLMFFWQFPTPGTPLFLVDCGPVAVFFKQARGAGMVLAGVVWYTLKDAAERGRLAASTFKQLNLAMALVAAVQLWGYWLMSADPAGVPMNPKLWNMLIGSGLLTVAFCDFQFFFAQK